MSHSDFVLNQNQNKTGNPDSDDLKWVKEDKIIIISHYHFLCKSESENSVSFWFCFISSHQIKVQFCLISWKMNLILSHLTEKKFDFISLKLLSFSVSFHFMKKNPVLFHFMKIKSDSVLSHQKKISFCSDSDSEQNWTRTKNSDSCDQSIHKFQSSADAFILFVLQKSEELHLCIDYHELNVIIIKDHYFLSLTSKLLDWLSNSIVFSKINL